MSSPVHEPTQCEVIESFLALYRREFAYFERLSQIGARICELELKANGIRGIISWRAKHSDRLRNKLLQRHAAKPYVDHLAIRNDIVDFAGVRIALYFPSDAPKVDAIIKNKFECKLVRSFPSEPFMPSTQQRFSGYAATHYRVCLKKGEITEQDQDYVDSIIEVQVATVLMHAWAEVNHDLSYKTLHGELSAMERATLDEINGLVIAGEIALDRLLQAVQSRVENKEKAFGNHYELAAFLYEKFGRASTVPAPVGRTDLLFRLLQAAELNSTRHVESLLKGVHPSMPHLSIADQVANQLVADTPSLSTEYARMVSEAGQEPYATADITALPVWTADADLKLVWANKAMKTLFPEIAKYVGRPAIDFVKASIRLWAPKERQEAAIAHQVKLEQELLAGKHKDLIQAEAHIVREGRMRRYTIHCEPQFVDDRFCGTITHFTPTPEPDLSGSEVHAEAIV